MSGDAKSGQFQAITSAMTRQANAIDAIRDAIITVAELPPWTSGIAHDDDLVDDLQLNPFELISLSLILEEIFGITVPESLWKSPIYRTPASLAEYCIRKSEEASWAESQRQRRRA